MTMQIDDIGAWIKTERLKAGLSQKRLGDLCGLSDTAIRWYETGKRSPKLDNIAKIAVALGYAPDIFITQNTYNIVLFEIKERIRCLEENERKASESCLYAKAAACKAAREEFEKFYEVICEMAQEGRS